MIYSRRTLYVLTVLMSLILLITGCSSDITQSENSSKTSTTASATSENSTFPAKVKGTYGVVEVGKAPKRIVALSSQYAAILVALGIQPIAVGFSEKDLVAQSPWLEGRIKRTFDPELSDLTGTKELNLEKLVSYEPDLVLGWSYQIPEDVYKQAKNISPVFTGLAADGPIPAWDKTTEAIATLTGTKAQPVFDRAAKTCEDTAKEISNWRGKTYQFVRPAVQTITFGGGDAFKWLRPYSC